MLEEIKDLIEALEESDAEVNALDDAYGVMERERDEACHKLEEAEARAVPPELEDAFDMLPTPSSLGELNDLKEDIDFLVRR